MALAVNRVRATGWRRLRVLRLAALAESPEMFGSGLARERAFDEKEWRGRAGRPATFIASLNSVDVGIASVYEFDGAWCVMGMWVAPEARGTGVVDALIHACESSVESAGAAEIALWVMEDNPRGIRAYGRLGFSHTDTRQHVRDGRCEMLMVKALRRTGN